MSLLAVLTASIIGEQLMMLCWFCLCYLTREVIQWLPSVHLFLAVYLFGC